MEANVIKCPNCGASSTNHTNCEYCGSLLVRFVDKGIDLSTTSYLTNDKVYAGLIDALKQNLDRQELSDSAVETGIFYKSSPTVKLSRKRHGVATVFRSGSTSWSDGDSIKLGDKNRGLVIKFSFDIHAEENDVSDERIERQHQEFKSLGSFPLFTSHSGIYMRPGSSSRFRSQEYAIDFGQDVEGAARLISEVLSKVYGIPEDAQLVYLGEEELPVEKIIEEPQEEVEQDEGLTTSQKVGLGVAVIIAICGFFTIPSIVVITSICSVCALAAVCAVFMGKLDKKYSWAIPGTLFMIFLALGLYNAPDSEDAKTWVKQKEKEYAAEKEKAKEDKKNQILESAYNSGSSDAWGASSTVEDLIRQGYTKRDIKGMQVRQGHLNYKEEYGEPKTSEEQQLMEQYAEKYAEGFMNTMFKD